MKAAQAAIYLLPGGWNESHLTQFNG